MKRIKDHLLERLEANYWFEFEPILNATASGILDFITFLKFRVFAYNQVVNIVVIGGLLAYLNFVVLPLMIVCIVSFLCSGLILALLGTYVGLDRRGWLYLLAFLQASLVIFGGVFYRHEDDGTMGEVFQYLVIVMLGCASGSQAVFARSVCMADRRSRSGLFKRLGSVRLRSRSVYDSLSIVLGLAGGTLLGVAFIGYYRTLMAGWILSAVVRMILLFVILVHPASERIERDPATTHIEVVYGAEQHNIELRDLA